MSNGEQHGKTHPHHSLLHSAPMLGQVGLADIDVPLSWIK